MHGKQANGDHILDEDLVRFVAFNSMLSESVAVVDTILYRENKAGIVHVLEANFSSLYYLIITVLPWIMAVCLC